MNNRNYQIIINSEHLNVYVAKEKHALIEVKTCCLSAVVPAYLRFDEVRLDYESLWSCEPIKLHLQHFKNALIGSTFTIKCRLANSASDHNMFNNASMFLEHFVKEVIPIINNDASDRYGFKMAVDDHCYHDFDVEEFITEIMAALPNSSALSFDFELELPNRWWKRSFNQTCLPVNQILHWLTRKCEQNMDENERILFISIDQSRVLNYVKMSNCVEKVILINF